MVWQVLVQICCYTHNSFVMIFVLTKELEEDRCYIMVSLKTLLSIIGMLFFQTITIN